MLLFVPAWCAVAWGRKQRSGDEELAERLKAFIMHLRKRDPQFATQDAMDEALEQGLFSTAAKVCMCFFFMGRAILLTNENASFSVDLAHQWTRVLPLGERIRSR